MVAERNFGTLRCTHALPNLTQIDLEIPKILQSLKLLAAKGLSGKKKT